MAKDITAKARIDDMSLTAKASLSGNITASASLGQTVVVGGTVLRPATTTTLGGVIVGDDLQITPQGVLSVIKAGEVDEDNTHPISAAAVYTEIGNINSLLTGI